MNEERAKASFDIRAMTLLMDGGQKQTDVREKKILNRCIRAEKLTCYPWISIVEGKNHARIGKRPIVQDGWYPWYFQVWASWAYHGKGKVRISLRFLEQVTKRSSASSVACFIICKTSLSRHSKSVWKLSVWLTLDFGLVSASIVSWMAKTAIH